MLIVHGTYLPQTRELILWAERDTPPKPKRGKQAKLPIHPFAATTNELAEWALKQFSHIDPEADTWVIHLPSDESMPQPSPERAETGAFPVPETLSLRAWKVQGISLSLGDAVDFLLSLPPHMTVGADLRFWRAALLYGLSLVVGQQVIPTLERDDFKLRAMWRANPEQPERVAELARQMPPICRAVVDSPEDALAPTHLLEQFLNHLVDHTVRHAARLVPTRDAVTTGGKWLHALTDPYGHNRFTTERHDDLYKAWETWAGQRNIAGNTAFRITFRLDAPEADSLPWTLHYLLQATDDPSLIVPAGDIWRGSGKKYLQQRFDQPQERLLAGLGFAARLFPPIMDSLRTAAPEFAQFSTDQAYQFLREIAPLLQGQGFRVLLPRWWGGKRQKLATRTKYKSAAATSKGLLSLGNLVHYEREIMLGGQSISQEEFEKLAALKQPLVMLRGQWVTLDEQQIAAGLKFFQTAQGDVPVGEAVRDLLDSDESEEQIEVTGWLESLLDSLRQPDKIATLPQPDALKAELRPYQQRGFSWLAFLRRYGLGACLADDMGLGKSIQAISLLLHERLELNITQPALIVCPTSVVGNWRREIARFAPELRVLVHQGAGRAQGSAFNTALVDKDVVITSYPLLSRDRETLEAVDWSTVILDEAQNIKNSSTRQSQAARALQAENRVALTGTPVENRLSELWSIMHFLNPGYLGSETHFRKQYAGPIERLNDAEAAKRLKQLTTPFILRRVKTDPTIISDLPEKLEMKVYCNLTPEQATLYEAVVKDAMEQVENAEGDSMSRRGLVLAMLLKLKQICNHPAQFLKDNSETGERSGKLSRLTEMLEEVYAAGDRALVFTQFAEMGELLRTHLREVFYDEPLWLHGGTPTKDREQMIARFQAAKGPTVFLLSIKAGGVGLNLTRANHVFHFDRWWNPAVENQATDRAYRIGQTRNVQVHKFICAGTLEEKIDEMIESKRALAASIVGSDEGWLTELSTSDLHELVRLRETES